jgi:hypothetical protein
MDKPSYIQIRTTDGRTLYTDWGNETSDVAARLRMFVSHMNNKYDSTFVARRLFIQGAPEYVCFIPSEQIVSLSLISQDWENVLDEGQIPVYLYEDEIRALINASSSATDYGTGYVPPALTSAYSWLEDALEEQDERLH